MNDETFGGLTYDWGWVGRCEYPWLGGLASVRLFIPCDEQADIEPTQREAFINFDKHKTTFLAAAEAGILNHYSDIIEDARLRAGDDLADEVAPAISGTGELGRVVNPTEIIIQQSFSDNDRIVGLLFDCSWDPSLGLAVKFVNEELREIGPQDIVL